MNNRVNMYASCYILTKTENLAPLTPKPANGNRGSSVDLDKLEI
jgi:betaine lipid synthase